MKILKRQCPDAEVLHIAVSPYLLIAVSVVQDTFSISNKRFVFRCSWLNLSLCLYTTLRLRKNEWMLIYKIVGLIFSS